MNRDDLILANSMIIAEMAQHLVEGDLTFEGLNRQRRRLRSAEFAEMPNEVLQVVRAQMIDWTCRVIAAHPDAAPSTLGYYQAIGDLLPDAIPDDLSGLA
jgi:hypothetical protein